MLHGNEIQNTLCIFVHSSLVLEINLQCCDLFQSICSYAKLQEGCTHIEIWFSTEPSAPSITHGWSQPVLVLWTFGSLFFILPHHNHLHTSRWYLKFSVCVWQDNIWGSTRKRDIVNQTAWVLADLPNVSCFDEHIVIISFVGLQNTRQIQQGCRKAVLSYSETACPPILCTSNISMSSLPALLSPQVSNLTTISRKTYIF